MIFNSYTRYEENVLTKFFIHDLGERSQAVGGARSIAEKQKFVTSLVHE